MSDASTHGCDCHHLECSENAEDNKRLQLHVSDQLSIAEACSIDRSSNESDDQQGEPPVQQQSDDSSARSNDGTGTTSWQLESLTRK
jgi:hypothetical protein